MIWILVIEHKFGKDMSVHKTKEAAKQSLYEYCVDQWDSGLDEQYGTLNELCSMETIDAYFESWGQGFDPEYYVLEQLEVQD